ncbi:GerMN domain-containing protein [Faecalimonas sp.]
MKKQKRILIISLLILVLFSGCQTKKEKEQKGPFLYYANMEGTALEKESYEIKEKKTEKAVTKMLEKLAKAPENIELKASIPPKVKIKRMNIKANEVHIYMNEKYAELGEVEEILCRASIVQSLTQIEGIEKVAFYIGEDPLKSKSGDIIGFMKADSFVRDTKSALKSSQQTTLTLFFPNEKGKGLLSEKVNVRYSGDTSIEKLVIEQLMKGPETSGRKPLLSSQVKVLNVSVKDGICYVNFDKQFLEQKYDVEPKVIIYGIVNSLISNGKASRVQIAVEGKTAIKFQETVYLNELLDRNMELVEQK